MGVSRKMAQDPNANAVDPDRSSSGAVGVRVWAASSFWSGMGVVWMGVLLAALH